jgi:hypothetical protein
MSSGTNQWAILSPIHVPVSTLANASPVEKRQRQWNRRRLRLELGPVRFSKMDVSGRKYFQEVRLRRPVLSIRL